MFKKIALSLLAIIVIALIFIFGKFWLDATTDKYDVEIAEDQIPLFESVAIDFTHKHNGEKSLPLASSALIDIDNDNVDELFFGGGMSQDDALFAYRDGQFVEISATVNLPKKIDSTTTLAAVSADFDNNGFTDLMISRENGLVIFYNTNGKFTETVIDTPVNEKSTPVGITVGDINKDGLLDIFLSTYLRKELMEGQTIFEDYTYGSTSELLLNNGDNTFKSITKEAGLDYIHNTFQGSLIDIDNDSWLDIIAVHDTGEVRTYKNNGDLTYTMVDNPITNRFAYPMGLAIGDYNNDGLVDFMFSNTGSTAPVFIVKGDIKDASLFTEKWILFENQGDFKFKDVAQEALIADYEFSWGAAFADMNNDGLQDLMVAENYIDFPMSKIFKLDGRLLIQKEDHTFAPGIKKGGATNPTYAITPLVSDFNKDGHLDLIWVNINDQAKAFINKGNNKNNYVQVHLADTGKEIGAKITVYLKDRKLTDWLVTGEGLVSDQTALVHFGLKNDTQIEKITIEYIDGTIDTVNNPAINTVVNVALQKVQDIEDTDSNTDLDLNENTL
ncbi:MULTISPECIES: CRTAC1 family protein [unclassified Nonlabens]|uniref:CRTAC1 family protein n=1 Tax=unclassified Nonlabens TaxID=2615035 RepID=UPI003867D95B